jgi:hypothetical protein
MLSSEVPIPAITPPKPPPASSYVFTPALIKLYDVPAPSHPRKLATSFTPYSSPKLTLFYAFATSALANMD